MAIHSPLLSRPPLIFSKEVNMLRKLFVMSVALIVAAAFVGGSSWGP